MRRKAQTAPAAAAVKGSRQQSPRIAKCHGRIAPMRGRPVTGTLGPLQLQTPAAWLVACLLLPEVALTAYVDCRQPA